MEARYSPRQDRPALSNTSTAHLALQDNAKYFYFKNAQGDITAIYDGAGNLKAEYEYDAWGNHVVTVDADDIGTLNPFRYRGYYYDDETGLYYFQSRYYDPEVGRFVSADDRFDMNAGFAGCNLFCYCANNPIINVDTRGNKLVNLRAYIESNGGTITIVPQFGSVLAIFELNGYSYTISCSKNYFDSFEVSDKSSLCAEEYIFAAYFNVGDWHKLVPGFRWYTGAEGDESTEGFQVDAVDQFLNKQFCMKFAKKIIDEVGIDGKYLG